MDKDGLTRLGFRLGTRTLRSDDLTIDDLSAVTAGGAWDYMALIQRLLTAHGEPVDAVLDMTVAEVFARLAEIEDDLPREFADGNVARGGRPFDGLLVAFAREPWCWPPEVTRRQRIRDLELILESHR